MPCDAASLINTAYANGYPKLSHLDLLMCIVNAACAGGGGGGGGGVTCGNYAGGQPNFTPASGCGNAIDTSNGRVWWYYGGGWH